ncbi:flagellar hook-basal body complex protein [Devosia sp. FJ2-5-3]|uniref:flagellar hook protein FlgE n=1 Tax=Devosia sp. FJ2-5-3 TaxID=2976680 RepID=UPI0023D86374|nr:flagellar hook-basal body complex protein [Devosia sp. FJ2-5-3]WEJ59960.1 flagellar hook-basal body complex protein [Devosia sp. FJ2-5-3]
MGIFGALQSAVSGLKAQSHAMENISGNIANSQTIGYKRIDTSFVDMIADAPVKSQVAGAVSAFSRSMNTLRGDIQNADTQTYMALNGNGFFVTEKADGSAGTFYTRRGDFDVDRNGYLVNGAGYRLTGLDMSNGVVTGSVAKAIQIDNSFLPAKKSTTINYQLNLPQNPKTAAYVSTTPGSELLKPWGYKASLLDPAAVNSPSFEGNAADATDSADTLVATDDVIKVQIGTIVREYVLDTDNTASVTAPQIKVNAGGTLGEMLSAIQADLRANGGPDASGVVVGINDDGNVSVDFVGNYRTGVEISGTGAAKLGIVDDQEAAAGEVVDIAGSDSELFIKESISGGGVTVYSQTGEPINIQMRWAKTSNAAGAEAWSLYYASDSSPGAAKAWSKIADYTFNEGQLAKVTGAPGVEVNGNERVTIGNVTVNGRNFTDLSIDHGLKGMTQFADNSGMATTTTLKQDGYGAGEFISVGISDDGRVVASYTNGENREVAQIITASFSNANALKRGDGGAYTITSESGEPIIDQTGQGIVGSSTEASNTDISEEFTKLIVTQQAYSANTKIVTAADEMLQEALNMIR